MQFLPEGPVEIYNNVNTYYCTQGSITINKYMYNDI